MNKLSDKALSGGINYVAQILDVFGVVSLSYLIHALYLGKLDLAREYTIANILAAVLMLFTFQAFNVYSSWRGRSKLERLRVISTSWLFVVILLVIITALLKMTAFYSRIWFVSWTVSTLIYLNFYRYLLDIFLNYTRKKGWNLKNVVIFGAGKLGADVKTRINQADWTGFNIRAYFDDDAEKVGKNLGGVPVLASKQLEKFILENQVRELWIALPFRAEERVKKLLFDLRHMSISIKFIPDIFGFRLLNQEISEVAGIPILQLNGTPIQGMNRVVKEVEDKVLAFIILILISPLLFVIAIAIKLESRGPILFKQVRNGWDGKVIKVYKFRSMKTLDKGDEKLVSATRNDSRVTKVGAFIRKTSLDELPQFLNVLQGRMSIVGPRPHVISQNEEYKDQVDYYMQRHRVKPGITGWAQINGFRGEVDTLEKISKRVEYDLYYIENWSLMFDLKIIFLTIFKGFINKNAY